MMVSLGDLNKLACFLATSGETDVFPVNISDFSAEVHPLMTFSHWFIVSCPGNSIITL